MLLARAARPTATGGDLIAAGVSSTAEAASRLSQLLAVPKTPPAPIRRPVVTPRQGGRFRAIPRVSLEPIFAPAPQRVVTQFVPPPQFMPPPPPQFIPPPPPPQPVPSPAPMASPPVQATPPLTPTVTSEPSTLWRSVMANARDYPLLVGLGVVVVVLLVWKRKGINES